MRTFLACSGIDGQKNAIDKLEELVRQRHPDAILFAGGLFAPPQSDESPAAAAERRHQDVQLLEQFFATLGATRTVAAVIPGPTDSPLRAFLMAGMNAQVAVARRPLGSLHHHHGSRRCHFGRWW